MPRDARGKTRASTRTFATNVHFENVLAKATPLFPIDAIDDTFGDPAGTPNAHDASDPVEQTAATPRQPARSSS